MKSVYQYKVSVWNYETGKVTHAVFLDYDEAQSFMDKEPGHEKVCNGGPGQCPLGKFTQDFDVDAARALRNREMERHGGVCGND